MDMSDFQSRLNLLRDFVERVQEIGVPANIPGAAWNSTSYCPRMSIGSWRHCH